MDRSIAKLPPEVGGFWQRLDRWAVGIGDSRVSLADLLSLLITIILLFVAAKLAYWLLNKAVKRTPRLDPTQRLLAQKLVGLGVFAIAILVGIDMVGLDLSALAVFSGAAGLAVGFGLQKTFGNLIAGLILLMDRSVKPGDVIVVGDHFGAINKIGIRAVSVITRDGKEHLIPNELLMTEPVENWSYSSRNVRIQVPVGVSYASDLDEVEKVLLECTCACQRVLRTPQPTIWLKEFGDSSVNFEIQAWISDPEEGVGNVQSEILKAVWRAFKDKGIEIPFPQRDLHVKSLPITGRAG